MPVPEVTYCQSLQTVVTDALAFCCGFTLAFNASIGDVGLPSCLYSALS